MEVEEDEAWCDTGTRRFNLRTRTKSTEEPTAERGSTRNSLMPPSTFSSNVGQNMRSDGFLTGP